MPRLTWATIGLSVMSLLWLILPGPVGTAYGLWGGSYDMDLYDIDPYGMEDPNEDEYNEYKDLSLELDAIGLDFDSPEVQGMTDQQIWDYIISGDYIDKQSSPEPEGTPPKGEDQP